jgi:hypothetical protein
MATRYVVSVASIAVVLAACTSSSSSSPSDAGAQGTATCASPGQPTPGPADTHCQGQPPQPVSPAACTPDAAAAASDAGGDDGGSGADECAYGATLFGQEGDDDDCKYHVKWTSTPLCEGAAGVQFTVTVTSKVDGSPVSGIPEGVQPEVFVPTSLDAACDDKSTHPSPSQPAMMETSPGSGVYSGKVVFDAPGEWTFRFHIHEECADLLPESQHGHVAFHLTIP